MYYVIRIVGCYFYQTSYFFGIDYSLDPISSIYYCDNHLIYARHFRLRHGTEINHEKKINNLGNTNMRASPHHQISTANMKLIFVAIVVVKIYWG